jgi:hypothetical protein
MLSKVTYSAFSAVEIHKTSLAERESANCVEIWKLIKEKDN